MNINFGIVTEGICSVTNPNVATLLNSDLGGVWTVDGIALGWSYLVGTGCAVSPFVLTAQNNSGKSVTYELQYNPLTGILYRPASTSGAAMGAGFSTGCSGCTDCIETFDDDLRTTGCDCIGSGTCAMTGGPIV